jgi:hypothetical protein
MKLKWCAVTYQTDRCIVEDSSKLRGYIGTLYPEHLLLHHHVDGTRFLYTYPKVQYKIIEGAAIIIGVNQGADILRRIAGEVTELKLGENTYRVTGFQMNQQEVEFGRCRNPVKYHFLTPWLSLNPKNYVTFKNGEDWRTKKELLNKILVGNILSMSKGLDYVVRDELCAHSLLKKTQVFYKAISHDGFTGVFRINFLLPDLIGIGKGVSQGFGTVQKIER